MSTFQPSFSYKLIYVFRICDESHKGLLKIGDATLHTSSPASTLMPNCRELNQAAKERINSYTKTAAVAYELLHTQLAIRTVREGGFDKQAAFRDHSVHNVLIRSGIERHAFHDEAKGREWFKTDLETVKRAISAVIAGRRSLNVDEITTDQSPIEFRPEQKKAIKDTITNFKNSDRMLWNAKMRFGKTLTALQVAKELKFQKTLIFTHRPVVNEGWYEDFHKIFYDTNYKYGSKTKGENIENLVDTDTPFVYFASIQDLRGSEAVGGKFDKNEYIFLLDWDFIIIDEAHEGTQTTLGQRVIEAVREGYPDKKPKFLELSGTPFNLLSGYKEGEIFTWDYIMEQRAKRDWPLHHFGDSNPYEELPRLEIYTYDLDKYIPGFVDLVDSSFNFREFFRTWTGDIKKDFKPVPAESSIGKFVHEDAVQSFLNLLTQSNTNSNFPYSTEEYRSYYRHTLWMVPGVKEARALSAQLKKHPVFGSGAFQIVNVAGEGDEEQDSRDALKAVLDAIGENPDETYTITISCGRLTTGVTVKAWTAVFMLAGSFSTSASNYLQTIFRVQSPANINGRIKERCSVFDFAPDRTLKMVAEAGRLSTSVGKTDSDRVIMGDLLNFCPVIALDGSRMIPYNVDKMLQQLKKAYTDRVVRNGFDDRHIYNDNLLKLDDIELADFENLKKIIGSTKQAQKPKDIDVNRQGFTDEEYEELERIERKPKHERTPEETALLEEKKKKRDNAQKAMSILRGISIRIPLLIYGAEVPIDQDITVENFVEMIDDDSWNEFMPTGVTKAEYKKFSKYYEQDVFVAAGRQIRKMAQAADELAPTERVQKIAEIFGQFKNPDKETVLTPWRVVNMHMSDCLGGYNFYNADFTEPLDEPVFVDRGKVTQDTLSNPNAKILEINSKTGLYPLYVAYSIFRCKIDKIPLNEQTADTVWELWTQTVAENVFVICKTPMAKAITRRTLLGYKPGKVNAHYFEDIINQLKNKPEQFKEKVTRGSYWGRKEAVMKFDAVVGNPPYQVLDGGAQASATPVYNLFVEAAKKMAPAYISMIMPARWFAGGKGLDAFRADMINDKRISVLHDFLDAVDCFGSSCEIKGGICYFLWNKYYNDKCKILTHKDGNITVQHDRTLGEGGGDVFIRYAEGVSVVHKVQAQSTDTFDNYVSSQKPFGLRTFVHGTPNAFPGSVKLYERGGIGYIDKKLANKNIEWIDKYKVFISAAYNAGDSYPHQILGKPILGEPNSCCTETYVVIGPVSSQVIALNVIAYIKTKFFRFLVMLKKSSQHAAAIVYSFVPLQDFTEHSDIDWGKSIAEIDQQLYRKYNLSDDEIAFIEKMIKPME